jgi:hypothetical protein
MWHERTVQRYGDRGTPIVALVAFGAAVWLVAASLDEIVDRIDAKYGGITATT